MATPASREAQKQDQTISFWLPLIQASSLPDTSASQQRCAALLAAALAVDAPSQQGNTAHGDVQAMAAAEAASTLRAPAAVAALACSLERCVAASHPGLGEPTIAFLQSPDSIQEAKRQAAVIYKEYTAHIKSLVFNLRSPGNTALRERVLSGRLPPASLAGMSTAELAPPELAHRYAKMRAEASAAVVEQWQPFAHNCPECASEDTRYALVSTRRDIGKNETWGAKEHSAAVIKVRCDACGHQYTTDDIM